MVGIYGIKNKKNGKIYVGQSIKIEKRWKEHIAELKKNKHKNKHLLRAFNCYGEDNFEFLILEECEKQKLNEKEEFWIHNFPKEMIYNEILYIIDVSGEKNPFYGKRHSEKTKKIISKKNKNKFSGDKNPNFGKKHSLDVRLKISENRAKLNKTKVLEIVQMLKTNMPHQEIADIYNISRTVITRISNGTRCTNVTNGAIIPIVYKDGKRVFTDNHKELIRSKLLGKKHSEETKKKISETKRRRNNG